MVETTEVASKKRAKASPTPATEDESTAEMVTVEIVVDGIQVKGISIPKGSEIDVTAKAAERLVAKKAAKTV